MEYIGIILSDELKNGVLTVKRSDRLIWMKLDLSGEVGNIISVNSPQI